MKLIFNKESNNEITVKIQKGTVAVDFTYIEMIKQLLEDNTIEDTSFNNLTGDEETCLNEMLTKVSEIFNEEETDDQTDEN